MQLLLWWKDLISSGAFRGTGAGIDIEWKIKENLRFPGFETYVPPEKDEEHINDLLIKEIEKREAKFQEEKKKRKRKEREEKKRKRAKERAQKMKN